MADLNEWIQQWVLTGETRAANDTTYNGECPHNWDADDPTKLIDETPEAEAEHAAYCHVEHYAGWLDARMFPDAVTSAMAAGEGQQRLSLPPAMPARSRYGDPVESDIAAESVDRAKSNVVKAMVMTAVAGLVLTDEEIVEHVAEALAMDNQRTTPQRVRTLRKELVDEGLLEEGPEKGTTRAGRPCRTWRMA